MKLVQGNMLGVIGEPNSTCFITTNVIIKNNGALVMGAGIAKAVRDMFPGIDKQFGERILNSGMRWHYGALLDLEADVNPFQVKHHYSDKADLELIRNSVLALKHHAETWPDVTFHLNFPGIGNGGLEREEVEPLLEILPDNVNLWTF